MTMLPARSSSLLFTELRTTLRARELLFTTTLRAVYPSSLSYVLLFTKLCLP